MKALTIDKLKVCYKIDKYQHQLYALKEDLVLDSFKLQFKYSQFSQVKYNVIYIGNEVPTTYDVLGEFWITLSEEDNDDVQKYAWFEFLNRMLYSVEFQDYLYDLLKLFEQQMEIQLNNVTNFELALDADEDLGKMIDIPYRANDNIKTILAHDYSVNDYVPYVCREVRGTPTEASLIHWRVSGQDSKFQLYCYDKKNEVSKHDKKYIRDYYHLENINVFWRLEIRVWKENMWDYIQSSYTTWDEFLQQLCNDETKDAIMDYFAGRFMRFKYSRINRPSVYRLLDNQLS